MKKATFKRGDFRAPRHPQTGQFENHSPQNDVAMLDYAVTYARACADLLPMFKGMAEAMADPNQAKMCIGVHMLLSGIRDSILAELALQDDKEALGAAKKARLRAPYVKRGEQ